MFEKMTAAMGVCVCGWMDGWIDNAALFYWQNIWDLHMDSDPV